MEKDVRLQQDLREWRQEAADRHQYETAIYVGDKLLAMTDDDHDALWLANAHFTAGDFHGCRALLARRNLAQGSPQWRYLDAHSAIKLGKTDEALQLLGDTNPAHLVAPPAHGSARQKLRHVERPHRMPTSEERDGQDTHNLRAEAAMCYLRGLCFAKQNSLDRAKDCYQTALRIDVRCMEAFNALVDNSHLSPDDEWRFLDSLNFDAPAASPETPDFVRNLYTTRLSKYARPTDFTNATDTLTTHYALANNPDILRSKADLLFTHCRFHDALALTSSVLARDGHNKAVLPLHLATMYQLRQTSALFLLAHNLADASPDEPAAWLAVGTYYLSVNNVADARRFFSKATELDQYYGPAWIGFAHSFASEGEHDQAISAYSTAARIFQGAHLPQLFLGMQNLQLGNLSLAREYLNTAYSLCQTDPLVLNEMGVVAYHALDLPTAIDLFRRSLQHLAENEADAADTLSMRINLAHALRKNNMLDESLRIFEDVLRHGTKDAAVFAAKGLVLMESDRPRDAVTVLHEALAVAPQDPMATDLLNRALEANESHSGVFMLEPSHGNRHRLLEDEIDDPGFEHLLRSRKQDALRAVEPNAIAGRRGRRRRHAGFVEDGESVEHETMAVDSDG